jgi:hypothetical protein
VGLLLFIPYLSLADALRRGWVEPAVAPFALWHPAQFAEGAFLPSAGTRPCLRPEPELAGLADVPLTLAVPLGILFG